VRCLCLTRRGSDCDCVGYSWWSAPLKVTCAQCTVGRRAGRAAAKDEKTHSLSRRGECVRREKDIRMEQAFQLPWSSLFYAGAHNSFSPISYLSSCLQTHGLLWECKLKPLRRVIDFHFLALRLPRARFMRPFFYIVFCQVRALAAI